MQDDSVQKLIDLYGTNVLHRHGQDGKYPDLVRQAVHDIVNLSYQTSCEKAGLRWYVECYSARDLEGMLTGFDPEGDRDLYRRDFLSNYPLENVPSNFITSAGAGLMFKKDYVVGYVKAGLRLPSDWSTLLSEDFFQKIENQEKQKLQSIEIAKIERKVRVMKLNLKPKVIELREAFSKRLQTDTEAIDKLQGKMEDKSMIVMQSYRSSCLKKIKDGVLLSNSPERNGYYFITEKYRSSPALHGGNDHAVAEEIQRFFSHSRSKECFFLDAYHPKNSEMRKSCGFSNIIIQLKRRSLLAVNSFLEFFAPLRLRNTVIVAVPGSNPCNQSGIRILADEVGKLIGCQTFSDSLKRTREIPKKSTGGTRDYEQELDSLKLDDAERFKGKNILLMDDVITTGGTMSACEEIIIRNSEPKSVVRFALGKTYSDYSNEDTPF